MVVADAEEPLSLDVADLMCLRGTMMVRFRQAVLAAVLVAVRQRLLVAVVVASAEKYQLVLF